MCTSHSAGPPGEGRRGREGTASVKTVLVFLTFLNGVWIQASSINIFIYQFLHLNITIAKFGDINLELA